MFQVQLVQAGQRPVQFPQDLAHDAFRKLRPFLFEKLAQAAPLDILHQLPPPAGLLPVGFDPDHMVEVRSLHAPDHLFLGRHVMAVDLRDETVRARGVAGRVASLHDVEIGLVAARG